MLTAEELRLLAESLERELGEARLKKIYGTPAGDLVLRFHRSGAPDHHLRVVLHGELPRVNLVPERPAVTRRPTPLAEALRRELSSARLKSLETLPGDRILRLRFEAPRGPEGPVSRTLVVELLPRLRNVVLLDGGQRVLLALRSGGSRRDLSQGAPYEPPGSPPPGDTGEQPFAFLGGLPDLAELPAALERHAGPLEAARRSEEVGRRLRAGLEAARKKEARLARRLQADLEATPDPEELQRRGEALKAHLHQVPRGAASVELPDYTRDGAPPLEVPLDPALSPLENAEKLFKRARKARRARPRLEERLARVRVHLEQVEELCARAQDTQDPESLAGLRQEAESRGILRPEPQEVPESGGRKAATTSRRTPYRRFTSRDGWPILVGRTSADNDTLTFRVARGNDYWFHVSGWPGSHVVVPDQGELPPETLLDAATLAVHSSKAPEGGKHEVSWTRRKWVRKFKGAKPGQVQLADRRTVVVRWDPDRLARLRAGPRS